MGVTLRPKGFRMLRILWLVLAAAIATPAFAQSKISVEGGPMIPLGEFNDWADVSWWAGLRGELRGTDEATGKPKSLSAYVRAAYSEMSFDTGWEEFFARNGPDEDASFLMGSAGIRTYWLATPLFLQAGAGYLRFDPPDDNDGLNGLMFEGGIGFSLPFKMIHGEAVALMHETLLDTESGFGDEDLPFLTVAAAISIPL